MIIPTVGNFPYERQHCSQLYLTGFSLTQQLLLSTCYYYITDSFLCLIARSLMSNPAMLLKIQLVQQLRILGPARVISSCMFLLQSG